MEVNLVLPEVPFLVTARGIGRRSRPQHPPKNCFFVPAKSEIGLTQVVGNITARLLRCHLLGFLLPIPPLAGGNKGKSRWLLAPNFIFS
jgi:hypothetical protein